MPDFSPRRGPGGRFVKGVLLLVAGTLLLGWAVMALWNTVLPAVLPVPSLGYWQAVGLLVLCRLLLGGWSRFGGGGGPYRRGPAFDKWERLSPEQRRQFQQRWAGRRSGAREE